MADTQRSCYAAFYPGGEEDHADPNRVRDRLELAWLEIPEGYIPPPYVDLGVPGGRDAVGTQHRFTYASDGTEDAIAQLFGKSQQTVSYWFARRRQRNDLIAVEHRG